MAARPFRAYLLSLSAIADDPRVRRMGDALAARGWTVAGVGMTGARGARTAWPVHEVPMPPPVVAPAPAALPFLAPAERFVGRMVAASLAPGEALLAAARSPYARFVAEVRAKIPQLERPFGSLGNAVRRRTTQWMEDARRSPQERIEARLHRRAPQLPAMRALVQSLPGPALWIANDWTALPLAEAGRDRAGGVIVYDSHELATEEYAELPEWRRFTRPLVKVVEQRLIAEAAVVSTVSPGITEHLAEMYALSVPRFTLLNAPTYRATPFRPTGETVRLLYHGVLAPGRGLEACIDAMALLEPRFTLTLRGPSNFPGYIDALSARAECFGERVAFAPPVPMTELVEAAAPFDIGLMVLPGHSLHADYALPNKLFEYLMAGLALAVTDLKEMGALVRSTGAGIAVGSLEAGAIAQALNALTPEAIDAMRRAALEAAKIHNFETQAGPVLDAYERAMEAA